MIQFIEAGYTVSGDRAILWRKGDYKYEVEMNIDGRKDKIAINAEYYDAVAEFKRILAK